MKTCALIIGHKKNNPGAYNQAKQINEFTFNDQLASKIETRLTNVNVERVYRRTYKSLPDDINELAPDFIISLHCNAFNQQVSGTETLYYHRSTLGKIYAQILQTKLVEALQLSNRGIKAKTAEDRGGYLLKYTNAPCLIAEPFFIDNDLDLAIATKHIDKLIHAYCDAIIAISDYSSP